jgi:hypothetical protein
VRQTARTSISGDVISAGTDDSDVEVVVEVLSETILKLIGVLVIPERRGS